MTKYIETVSARVLERLRHYMASQELQQPRLFHVEESKFIRLAKVVASAEFLSEFRYMLSALHEGNNSSKSHVPSENASKQLADENFFGLAKKSISHALPQE